MESLSDTKWDVVISGTGLQQSLLALALSRSDKNILHVDTNDYYGGPEAAFSLQEVDEWAGKHQLEDATNVFAAVQVTKENEGLAASRSYSLALAPQMIHTRSELLSQLVSSKAFRQVEFLAVGSFYIYQPPSGSAESATLTRIPSTREDVFTNTSIATRAKRWLMKFLKFVLDYDSEPQTDVWKPHADAPLADFLQSEFKLDKDLQSYVVTLTLSLDGKISVGDGLAAIHRHLTSMGVFGAGFAAVYPKWGGLSEVAQVGCRAAAVGGAVYMLGTGVTGVKKPEAQTPGELDIALANGMDIKAKSLAEGPGADTTASLRLSRLTAIIDSGLPSLFEAVVEGSPAPCVAVVAFPAGSVSSTGASSDAPIYAMVHSSDTGECPAKQCVLYLSTISSAHSKSLLENALVSLLATQASEQDSPKILYRLSYEQSGGSPSVRVDDNVATFAAPPLDLAFNDSVLGPVREAWDMVASSGSADETVEYMKFVDREGQDDEEDAFDS